MAAVHATAERVQQLLFSRWKIAFSLLSLALIIATGLSIHEATETGRNRQESEKLRDATQKINIATEEFLNDTRKYHKEAKEHSEHLKNTVDKAESYLDDLDKIRESAEKRISVITTGAELQIQTLSRNRLIESTTFENTELGKIAADAVRNGKVDLRKLNGILEEHVSLGDLSSLKSILNGNLLTEEVETLINEALKKMPLQNRTEYTFELVSLTCFETADWRGEDELFVRRDGTDYIVGGATRTACVVIGKEGILSGQKRTFVLPFKLTIGDRDKSDRGDDEFDLIGSLDISAEMQETVTHELRGSGAKYKLTYKVYPVN